jgi:hypothetical protein
MSVDVVPDVVPELVPELCVDQSLEVALDEDAATAAEAADTCEAPDAAAAAAAAASGRRRGGGDTIFWISPTRCAVNGLFDPSD